MGIFSINNKKKTLQSQEETDEKPNSKYQISKNRILVNFLKSPRTAETANTK